jgi:hypothetical protein
MLTINTRKPDDAHILETGARYKIMPGTAHLISNRGTTDCLFLLVQGVGKYDFLKGENFARFRSSRIANSSSARPRESGDPVLSWIPACAGMSGGK